MLIYTHTGAAAHSHLYRLESSRQPPPRTFSVAAPSPPSHLQKLALVGVTIPAEFGMDVVDLVKHRCLEQ